MASSPVLNQLKTRATGWIGSKYVGVPGQAAPAAPAPAAPAPTQAAPIEFAPQSQPAGPKTLATGWRGSQYIGAPATNTGIVAPDAAAGGAPRANVPLEGYDQTKLADPNLGTSHKYVGGRILQSGGTIDDVLADPKFAGWQKVSADKIKGPDGGVYDLTRDLGGANAAQWTKVGGPGWEGVGDGTHERADARAAAAAAQGGAAGGAAGSDWQNQVRAMLMQQMQGYAKPVSMDDPGIQGEMAAQERTLERGRQDRRAAMAERMAASGQNSGGAGSGAMESEIAAGYEDKGAAKTGLQAQLYSRELSARRDKMMQSLQLALQTGDAESARSLQLQMAQMDDEMRRLGLNQQKSQWDDSYGLQTQDAAYQRDRDAARAKSGLPF